MKLFFSLNTLLSFIIISFSLTGCNSAMLKNLVKAPEIKDIQLSDFSPRKNEITFAVKLYNPNSFVLPIKGLSGDIQLNDVPVGKLNANSEKSLAALSTQEISVPIQLNADALKRVAKSILFNMKADYQFKGFIKTSVAPVPFNKEGNLSAKDIISAVL